MIVRWGLGELPGVLDDIGSERAFLIASTRWSHLDLPAAARWSEVPSHRIPEIAAEAQGADGILAVGGGSAIDLAKAVSAVTKLPLVSIPTTYSGAEWTPFYGVRDPQKHMVGGGGGAHLAGIVYDPELTLDLPAAISAASGMNAIAHCVEALYAHDGNPIVSLMAEEGIRALSLALPKM